MTLDRRPATALTADERRIFQPLDAGRLQLGNRLMAPPHAAVIHDLFGSEEAAEDFLAYWESRADGGVGWVDGISGIISSCVPVGFDPSGIGARVDGIFRRPVFHERAARYADMLHSHGVYATGQLIHQGGMPHGASPLQSSRVNHQIPHVLTTAEIAWFVREFAFSARCYDDAGLDGVEIHVNNDDILQWFISPRTNHRTDEYGGSVESRLRFVLEIVQSIRESVSPSFSIGVRLTMDEREDPGYHVDDTIHMAQLLEAHGIDYLHGVIGSPWGNPGYIPPAHWPPGSFAPLAGAIKREVTIPVVYNGRVTTPALAEAILAAGDADVIGLARALISDGQFVTKAREGRDDEIQLCIGCNECINRVQTEAIAFTCTVNPAAGHERRTRPAVPTRIAADMQRPRVLVVGGGPAGLAFAARAAERGLDVRLWDRADALGGQVRIAARAPGLAELMNYVTHQERSLAALGVDVQLGRCADAESVREQACDIVVVATGARSRRPAIDGLAQASVHDVRDVLVGEQVHGARVVVVSQDDHIAPLSVAEVLARAGKQVHVVCQTTGPSPLLGRHTAGTVLARLSDLGVTWTFMEQAVRVAANSLHTRNVFSERQGMPIAFDSLVLACGAESETALAESLDGTVDRMYVIGDAFAPRRMSFATKQGYFLAEALADEAEQNGRNARG